MSTSSEQLQDPILEEYRQRVSGHGPNRLLFTTFLASLSFGALVAVLSITPAKDLPSWPFGIPGWPFGIPQLRNIFPGCVHSDPNPLLSCDSSQVKHRLAVLGVMIDLLLGTACLLFLLSIVSSYQAVQFLSNIPPDIVRSLNAANAASAADRDNPAKQKVCNRFEMYRDAGHVVPYGIACVILSVPLIFFYISVFAGVIITALLVLVVWCILPKFRDFLRNSRRDYTLVLSLNALLAEIAIRHNTSKQAATLSPADNLKNRYNAFAFLIFDPMKHKVVADYVTSGKVASDAGSQILILFVLNVLNEMASEPVAVTDTMLVATTQEWLLKLKPHNPLEPPGALLFRTFELGEPVVYVPLKTAHSIGAVGKTIQSAEKLLNEAITKTDAGSGSATSNCATSLDGKHRVRAVRFKLNGTWSMERSLHLSARAKRRRCLPDLRTLAGNPLRPSNAPAASSSSIVGVIGMLKNG